jgi:lipid-A-disaccharide synthase
LIEGKAIETVACSDCVVVASGTASLECALLEKPMCIIYKASQLTYMAAAKFIKVKYLGLCNLLQNEMVVPELLQYDCNSLELTRIVTDLLEDPEVYQRMQRRLKEIRVSLSAQEADQTINTVIEELLAN